MKHTYKICYFNDASIFAMMARRQANGKWRLYSRSEILGQGNANFDDDILGKDYDEVVTLNSFKGHCNLMLRDKDKWSLILIEGQEIGLDFTWKFLSDSKHSSSSEMLHEFGIERSSYFKDTERVD